jgi:hypothetical protein
MAFIVRLPDHLDQRVDRHPLAVLDVPATGQLLAGEQLQQDDACTQHPAG